MTDQKTDYLAAAKRALPIANDAAKTLALVSIAESLAALAGDLREERLGSESLRGALAEARAEADEALAVVEQVSRIVADRHGTVYDAIRKAVTE